MIYRFFDNCRDINTFKNTGTILFFEKKSRQKKLRLSGMMCRFFDNCINECYIVGEGYAGLHQQAKQASPRRVGVSPPVVPILSIYKVKFILFQPPSPREGDRNAVEGVYRNALLPSFSCENDTTPSSRRGLQTLTHLQIPPSRRCPARQQRAKLIEYFIDLKEILCYHISYRNGYFMN